MALFSCKSSKETIKTEIQENPEPVVFTELNTGTNSGFTEKKNQVIQTQNEFNTAWGKAFKNYFNKPKPQQVDFESSQLILVAMGEQNSGGYTIKVNAIEETTTAIVVTIEETKPGKSCASTSVMTYPYQIVSLKKSDKKILFKTKDKIFDCEQ